MWASPKTRYTEGGGDSVSIATPVNKARSRHRHYNGSECQECRPDSNRIDVS